jgi:hypothetical protein
VMNGGKRNGPTNSNAVVRQHEQQMPLDTILSQFISLLRFLKFVLILYSHPVPGISSKIFAKSFCDRSQNIFILYPTVGEVHLIVYVTMNSGREWA